MARNAGRPPGSGLPKNTLINATSVADRRELSLKELAAEVTAQRARAQRSAKRTAMRKSGHGHQVAQVYQDLVTVETLARKPRNQREYADRCNMPYRTWARHLATLEGGGWVTRTRGGGQDNPTRFVTHIGRPIPPRPEPKSGAQRYREWYRRQKDAPSRESGTQPNAKVAHKANGDWHTNLTRKRGTIQPEPNGTFSFGPAGQPTFSALIGSDRDQEPTEVAGPATPKASPSRPGNHTQTPTPSTAATPPPVVAAKGLTRCAANSQRTRVPDASEHNGPPAQQIPDGVLHGDQPGRSVRARPRWLADRSTDDENWPELAPDNPWASVNMRMENE